MAEELLDRADVGAVLEQMGGEGVPEGVAGDALRGPSALRRLLHRALEHGGVQVVADELARLGIAGEAGGRKDPLPAPLAPRVRILPFQGVGERDPGIPLGQIAAMEVPHGLQMARQPFVDAPREGRDPLAPALALADHELSARRVDVLDAQPQALQEPQAGAVEQRGL